ncbi:hypothetical protein JKP88DRAFT_163828 [Tribonema minus]|uniref:Calpain catalytic domain-containing protein n=1 Tax=Tribonema minus TaxID=303371 RepID=A0A835Z124_9STRA|nr:hypothetical protein JKP88DRAFT_163828 [Tribonema minus]
MHAYSLLDLKEIDIGMDAPPAAGAVNGRVRLVRCRNPWGYGEWEGDWSDACDAEGTMSLREKYADRIAAAFDGGAAERTAINSGDGDFFISFRDWCANFTHLFIGIDFPDQGYTGQRAQGKWDLGCGGNRQASTTALLETLNMQ